MTEPNPNALLAPQPPRRFPPPEPGEAISHNGKTYLIGQRIGAGAFGTVFAATDDWGNDLVAKVLQPRNATDEQLRGQWRQELAALVTLRHPNITFVHDAFEYHDNCYLILERCSHDLHGLLALPNLHGDLWLPWLARDLLQALQFLHDFGWVHKDLHPGNVFILWQRDRMVPSKEPVLVCKLGDLGISRLESDINLFGTAMAAWMLPPEYLDAASFGPVGRPVDVYHAGLLFLGLLVGSTPSFTRDEVLAGVPRQRAESLASPYGPTLARALRRHTKDRTPSPLQLWREIRQVATGV